MRFSFSARTVAATVALAATTPIQAGATFTWPSATCNGTLQACVDASGGGGVVEIATNTPINESLVFALEGLSLRPANGFQPRFAPGRGIAATLGHPDGVVLDVQRLGFTDGGVSATCENGGSASVRLTGLTVSRGSGGTAGKLSVTSSNGCTVDATIENNRIDGEPTISADGLLQLTAIGGTLNAYAAHNTLSRSQTGSGVGAGIFVNIHHGAAAGNGVVRLFGNTIHGRFENGSLSFSEGMLVNAPNELTAVVVNNVAVCPEGTGRGIHMAVKLGSTQAQVLNNSISGCNFGMVTSMWSGAVLGPRISGHVANNLIRARTQGLSLIGAIAPTLVNDYNLINAPTQANVAVGPNTLSAPAQLVSAQAPRLRPESPAINAANGTLLANVLVEYGLPATDGDGLRRVKGPSADIGAYEWGDTSLRHVASTDNTTGHISAINHPATNGNAAATVLPTRVHHGGSRVFTPYGVWHGGNWTIYHDDESAVPVGSTWNAFVPTPGTGAFLHTGHAGNTTNWATTIDHPAVNGQRDRIILLAYNWTGSGTYNAHHSGLHYNGANNRWQIVNLDFAALPVANAFNVYSQAPSNNAFRLPARVGSHRTEIDHPLVNGVACANIHVTHVSPLFTSATFFTGFDLEYSHLTGRWSIYGNTLFTAENAFNVLIDPAQVFDCSDRIFDNGFD